jgi:hypothetical protein
MCHRLLTLTRQFRGRMSRLVPTGNLSRRSETLADRRINPYIAPQGDGIPPNKTAAQRLMMPTQSVLENREDLVVPCELAPSRRWPGPVRDKGCAP